MADSQAVNIDVLAIQTYLYAFDMSPKSGTAPFVISIAGFLSNYDYQSGDIDGLNGEVISLQVNNQGTWTDTGITATTKPTGSTWGFFDGTFTVDPNYMPAGTYQFRAFYAGNNNKGYTSSVSSSVTVTVASPEVQTYLYAFDMTPKSGKGAFVISFAGFLSNYNYQSGDNSALNGETISIQISSQGTWADTGITATTRATGSTWGFFDGSFTVDPSYMPAGTYQFRAHYAGNTTKNLIGCE